MVTEMVNQFSSVRKPFTYLSQLISSRKFIPPSSKINFKSNLFFGHSSALFIKVISEILKEVVVKSFIFWDKTSCNPFKANRRFRGIFRLPLQSYSILRMENIFSSEKSFDFQRSTRRYIPENRTLLRGKIINQILK
jgi:hypothetical protein